MTIRKTENKPIEVWKERQQTMRWILVLFLLCVVCGGCSGQVTLINIPSSLSFNVTNVNVATVGSPNPFVINFLGLAIPSLAKFYISVKANAANFTPPSGTAIPASNVSWTTPGVLGGTGTPGTLSSTAYTSIFQSNLLVTLGYVNVVWQLAAPGAGIRAGNHTLTITYKLQAF